MPRKKSSCSVEEHGWGRICAQVEVVGLSQRCWSRDSAG